MKTWISILEVTLSTADRLSGKCDQLSIRLKPSQKWVQKKSRLIPSLGLQPPTPPGVLGLSGGSRLPIGGRELRDGPLKGSTYHHQVLLPRLVITSSHMPGRRRSSLSWTGAAGRFVCTLLGL